MNSILKNKLLGSALLSGFILANPALADTETYTLDPDFALGDLDGVNYTLVADQLQLNETGTTFPYLWVANYGDSTFSKINTDGDGGNGCEEARYLTWFGDALNNTNSTGPAPSRTGINTDGDAYVANRHFDGGVPDIIKFSSEGGVDRNGNGVIDTSTDTNGDCRIQPEEMLSVVDGFHSGVANGVLDADDFEDERVIWVRQFGEASSLGRSLCLDGDGNVWAGTYSARNGVNPSYYKFDPDGNLLAGPIATGASNYGCAVDGDGILWGATLGTALVKLDTNTNSHVTNYAGSHNYGITLGNDKVYLGSTLRSFDPLTDTFGPTIASSGTGVAVDGDGAVWFGTPTLRKFEIDPNTGFLNPTPVCSVGTSGVRGPIIDKEGHAWSINLSANSVSQYDTNCTLVSHVPVGKSPYTYSDATGFSLRNFTTQTGTWTIVKDTGAADTALQSVSWNGLLLGDGEVEVEARVAAAEAGLTAVAYVTVTNGDAIIGMTGQFIQVRVRLTESSDEESPELFDLTIEFGGETSNEPPTVTGNGPFEVDEGGDVEVSATASDPDGDALTWEWFVDENNDGVVDAGDTLFSTDESPTYSGGINGPATHQLLVRVSDPNGATATDTVTVNVLSNEPPTVTGNGPFGVDEGSDIEVSATASDPDGDALTWEWFVDENNDGVVDAGDTLFSTDESPNYSGGIDGPDTHQLLVRVSDSGGETATDTVTVNVLNVDPVITEVTGEPVEPVSEDEEVVLEVIVGDPGVPDTHQYSWDWGDGSGPTTDATGTHSYSTPGTYTVTVTVTDDDGGSVSYSFEIVVLLSATRTQGFWRTHGGNGGYTCHVLGTHLGGSIDLGWQTLKSCEDVAGAMWAKIARESDKGKRSSKSCKAKINPSWQLTAAILNTGLDNNAVVPIDPVTGKNIIEAAQDIFTAGTVREIRRIGGLLDAYNNSKDDRKIIDNDGQKVGRANPGGTKKTRTKDILDCP